MIITHEDDVASFATRVVRLDDGRIVSDVAAPARGAAVNLVEALRIALRALRANRLRSVLTTTGIIIGVVRGDRAGRAGQRDPGRASPSSSPSLTTQIQVTPTEDDRSAQPLTDADVEALGKRTLAPDVASVTPVVSGSALLQQQGAAGLPHRDHRHDRELRRRHRPRAGHRHVLRRAAGAHQGQGRDPRDAAGQRAVRRRRRRRRSASGSGSAARRSG